MKAKSKNESKQTVINLIANFIAYATSIGISFVLTPFLISNLGKEVYSFYPMANTFLNYMIVVTSALSTIACRFVTIYLKQDDEITAKKYFKGTLIVDFILGIVVTIPMALIVIFVDSLLNVPVNSIGAIRILFASIFASGIVNIFSSVFGVATFACNRIDLRSVREITTCLIRAGMTIFIYSIFSPSIIYVGLIALCIALINALFQIIYTKKLLPNFSKLRVKVEKTIITNLLKSSLWTVVASIGNMLIASSATIFANIFFGESASGTISIVLTIPGFLSGIITTFVGVYYPLIMYRVAKNDIFGLIKLIKRVEYVIGGFGIAVIAVFSAASSSFFSLWVSSENTNELVFLSFLAMIPYITTSSFWICQNLFTSFNKVKVPALFTLGFGLSNILFMLLFGFLKLPYWTLLLIASLHSFCWTGLFMPLYAKKLINIRIADLYTPFLKSICCGIIIYGLCFALTRVVILDSWIKFILYAIIIGISSLIIMYYVMDREIVYNFLVLLKNKITNFKRNK